MWKWYVYELRDPDSKEIFYVGKGCDERLNSHTSDETTEKGKKIAEIYSRGKQPLRIIIGRFENEEQAFAVEATLIKWVYGKNSLKNCIQGHAHKFIRPKSHLSESQICEIEGIDIPPKDGMNIMRLVEFDRAMTRVREKSIELALVIEELVNYFISTVSKEFSNVKLIYRASETRLSFFLANEASNIDLQKRQPADPIVRIFFKSSLNKNGRLHLSFNRNTKIDFIAKTNKDIETKLGVLNKNIDDKKIDLILINPIRWQESEKVIKDLLINSLKK